MAFAFLPPCDRHERLTVTVEKLTPAQLAKNDQRLAALYELRDAMTQWAALAHFADYFGRPQAARAARLHIAMMVHETDPQDLHQLIIYMLGNTLRTFVTYEFEDDTQRFFDDAQLIERERIQAFLDSDGIQCCVLGPEGHEWRVVDDE